VNPAEVLGRPGGQSHAVRRGHRCHRREGEANHPSPGRGDRCFRSRGLPNETIRRGIIAGIANGQGCR
jgi:hypothetical protein